MPSLFPPLSLSLFIYPLPSFVSVLIERTFLPSFRETARKNIKSTRILMIPRACRIGNGSMFRRGLPERSLRGGGERISPSNPRRIYCDTGDPRTNLPSPARKILAARSPSKWMARVREGEALAELRNAARAPLPLLSLSLSLSTTVKKRTLEEEEEEEESAREKDGEG